MIILFAIYLIAGYWAVNKLFYENKIVIYSDWGWLFIRKLSYAMILGWALIPIAIIKKIFMR